MTVRVNKALVLARCVHTSFGDGQVEEGDSVFSCSVTKFNCKVHIVSP